jgi:hypothetical protein
VPAGGEYWLKSSANGLADGGMGWMLGRLGHHESVDQIETITLGEDACLNHFLVLFKA